MGVKGRGGGVVKISLKPSQCSNTGQGLVQNIAVAMQERVPPIRAMFLSCTKQTVSDASRNASGSTAQTTSILCHQNTSSNSISNSFTSCHVSAQGLTVQTNTQSATASSTAYFLSCKCPRRHRTDQDTTSNISNSIRNSLLPVMSVRKAVKLTKQPTRPPSRSGLFLPELGVPTTRSSLPLYRRSSTLKAASTVTNRLLPQRCANRLSCSTPFTGMITCASTITPEPVIFSQQV